MQRIIIVAIVAITLIGGVLWGAVWYESYRVAHELSWQRAAKLPLAGYSLQGKVESVGQGSITATVGRVERASGGTSFVSYEKTYPFATTVSLKVGSTTRSVSSSALSASLSKGDSVVLYGSGGSPWEGSDFTVSKIELLSSGEAPALPQGAPTR